MRILDVCKATSRWGASSFLALTGTWDALGAGAATGEVFQGPGFLRLRVLCGVEVAAPRIPDASLLAIRLLEIARSTGSERPISRKEACECWSFENSDESEASLGWEVSDKGHVASRVL